MWLGTSFTSGNWRGPQRREEFEDNEQSSSIENKKIVLVRERDGTFHII
jgi:hypothetical protein